MTSKPSPEVSTTGKGWWSMSGIQQKDQRLRCPSGRLAAGCIKMAPPPKGTSVRQVGRVTFALFGCALMKHHGPYSLPPFEHVQSFEKVYEFIGEYRDDAEHFRSAMDEALKEARGRYHGPFRYRYREYPRPTKYPPWYFNQAMTVTLPMSLEIKEPLGPEGVIVAHEVYEARPDLREQMTVPGPTEPPKAHQTLDLLTAVLQQSPAQPGG
ncbi:hypothetical protein BESB_059240 [Besnoitia besnoiti]|uniref:Uncharacterized protein n=1 Tax=Besnoitia besnoiti TaxID=94643 RepID=A0A2A9MHG9_BESBE|nr:hypothetical protein BESB_059240 [Besnoitia besnoiti]PFH35037.1 hypothetical protein BESB_059240 [Besnoitia besnoiti]